MRGDDLIRHHARRLLASCGLCRPRPAEDDSADADLARAEMLAAMLAALTDGKPDQRQQIARIFAGA